MHQIRQFRPVGLPHRIRRTANDHPRNRIGPQLGKLAPTGLQPIGQRFRPANHILIQHIHLVGYPQILRNPADYPRSRLENLPNPRMLGPPRDRLEGQYARTPKKVERQPILKRTTQKIHHRLARPILHRPCPRIARKLKPTRP